MLRVEDGHDSETAEDVPVGLPKQAVNGAEDEDYEVVSGVKTKPAKYGRKRAVSEGSSVASEEESDSEASKWYSDDEAETGQTGGNRCIFCHEEEDDDPSEEYEEYLACSVCGDNAHSQCARENGSLTLTNARPWRCRDCVANDFEADQAGPGAPSPAPIPSTPNMLRNLKPMAESNSQSALGPSTPGDHGSRSLRKRKASTQDDDVSQPELKRLRSGTLESLNRNERTDSDPLNADESSPRSRSGRSLRQPKPKRKGAWLVSRSDAPRSLVMSISVTPMQWNHIDREVLRKQKRRERDRLRRLRNARQAATAESDDGTFMPMVQTSMYTNPYYPFPDRETDETKGKPYGGILNDDEADTSRTFPTEFDRQMLLDGRSRAEQYLKERRDAAGETVVPTRSKIANAASKIRCANIGEFEIDTWHAAPYPEEYSRNRNLYICEFCLKYMASDYVAWRHKLKCPSKHPPGDEIYRDNVTNPETGKVSALSFFEVDGRKNPLYCQNLCLLAKLFLGSKTLYYDVEPFLFYIMTESTEYGCHFVGYFSKEKRGCASPSADDPVDSSDAALNNPGNNVSCILVLPVHMRRGFGRVLIEFSYLLTKVERRTGSPEKPLSDMGLVSYRSYWRHTLCKLLLDYRDGNISSISINRISRETGMTPDDVISTLEALRSIVRDPVTGAYALRLDYAFMQDYVDKHEKKRNQVRLDPSKLCWTPYVMGRSSSLFAAADQEAQQQPMQTVAPRPIEESVAPEVVLPSAETAPAPEAETDSFPAFCTRSRSSTSKPPVVSKQSTTPAGFAPSEVDDEIPPSRYEIFPPLPGAQAKSKPSTRPPRGCASRRAKSSNRGKSASKDVSTPGPTTRSSKRLAATPSDAGDEENTPMPFQSASRGRRGKKNW
ncbi:hypothetical protein K470DRAFT_247077 [Piedraia hortae CBS 480.64]|uniref:Histone acetyltransferase n=1 Tax=Piedraia hortae CBS 480.64 TaxID=1314780 RepID=A0A6A7C1A1_9PEZI|nr:hypothetical protein K470DRAFT_247077 [Piedraia hortae CBS 480.64]